MKTVVCKAWGPPEALVVFDPVGGRGEVFTQSVDALHRLGGPVARHRLRRGRHPRGPGLPGSGGECERATTAFLRRATKSPGLSARRGA